MKRKQRHYKDSSENSKRFRTLLMIAVIVIITIMIWSIAKQGARDIRYYKSFPKPLHPAKNPEVPR